MKSPQNTHHVRAKAGMERLWNASFCQLNVTSVRGREIEHEGRTFIDFATSGYLGLDSDITEADVQLAQKWGLRNGWSRITGNTSLNRGFETDLASELGLNEVRLAQSISLINLSITNLLSRQFPLILIDSEAHSTIKTGANLVRNAPVRYWKHNKVKSLAALLKKHSSSRPALIVIDGVYSMKGIQADIRGILDVCHQYNCFLVIDDAHGFGVCGENGLGVIDGLEQKDLERVFYVASFSKCSLNQVAFVGFPKQFADLFDKGAPFLCYSGPPSNVHVAVARRQFSQFRNAEYIDRRKRIAGYSHQLHGFLADNGIESFSHAGCAIVTVRLKQDLMEQLSQNIFESGLLGKVAIYPITRSGEEVARFTLTARHSQEQVDVLMKVLLENREYLVVNGDR